MRIYPGELQNIRQWVCWRLEKRRAKATKIPVNPHTGAKASTTVPSTWGAFDVAIARMQCDGYPGVGFVFAVSDPFFGIDLDHCMDTTTGEIALWAQTIIDRLDTHTALSQSGTGVHIIGKGTLPPGRRRQGPVEMYDQGRFFALTGQHYPSTRLTIENRQAEIVALHAMLFPPQTLQRPAASGVPSPVLLTDTALLEKMFMARNGAMVQRLWAGDTSGYSSHSECDLALCSHLAFWTGGDAARIDALFRQSGLYREQKWNRQDYRERTIAKALEQRRFSAPAMPQQSRTPFTRLWTPGLMWDIRASALRGEDLQPWH
jgi:primase-polymerase (primpol)-like protein